MPVAKVHENCGITACFKNYVGTGPRCAYARPGIFWNADLHDQHTVDTRIDPFIADLASFHPPDYNVVDGIRGLQLTEHNNRQPDQMVRNNLVLAGEDTVATDAVVAKLLGFNGADVDYLQMGAARGLTADFRSLTIIVIVLGVLIFLMVSGSDDPEAEGAVAAQTSAATAPKAAAVPVTPIAEPPIEPVVTDALVDISLAKPGPVYVDGQLASGAQVELDWRLPVDEGRCLARFAGAIVVVAEPAEVLVHRLTAQKIRPAGRGLVEGKLGRGSVGRVNLGAEPAAGPVEKDHAAIEQQEEQHKQPDRRRGVARPRLDSRRGRRHGL